LFHRTAVVHGGSIVSAAIHAVIAVIVHVAMLAMSDVLTIMHIAGARLHGLRCEQYKYGQKNVFHSTIIHLYAVLDVIHQ